MYLKHLYLCPSEIIVVPSAQEPSELLSSFLTILIFIGRSETVSEPHVVHKINKIHQHENKILNYSEM